MAKPQVNPNDSIRAAYMKALTEAPSEPSKRNTVGGVAENVQTAVDKFQKGDIGAGVGAGIGGIADFLNSSVGQNILAGAGGDIYEKQAHLKGAMTQEQKDAAAAQAYQLAKQKQADLQKEFVRNEDLDALERDKLANALTTAKIGQNTALTTARMGQETDIYNQLKDVKDPAQKRALAVALAQNQNVPTKKKAENILGHIPIVRGFVGTTRVIDKPKNTALANK